MSELPPDEPRLRAILAHLDQQLANNATIDTYLRLQRDAVRAAIGRTEQPKRTGPAPRPDPRPAAPASAPGLPAYSTHVTFVVQQKRTANGPEPAMIHTGDCTMIDGPSHPIRDHEARVALTDPTIAPCTFCRPDTELGLDVA